MVTFAVADNELLLHAMVLPNVLNVLNVILKWFNATE